MTAGETNGGGPGTQRLDRWLWFARLVKSRTLAGALVAAGKIRVNAVRTVKPSHAIRAGDVLTAAIHTRVRVLKITGLGARRGPALEARGLYEDLAPAIAARGGSGAIAAPVSGERLRGSGRPTKRERREMDRMNSGPRYDVSDIENQDSDDM